MSDDSKTQHATGQLPVIQQIKIDSPCSMNWDEMDGDAQKRFCNSCQLHVHNFAEMHLSEVKKVLGSSNHVCAKILQRPDGSIVTIDDRPTRRSWLAKFGSMAAAVAAILTVGGCREEPITGEISRPVPPTVEPIQLLGEVEIMGGAEANPAWLENSQAEASEPANSDGDLRVKMGKIAAPIKAPGSK